jgi:enolase
MKQYIEIVDVLGREILDSRGNPTVEVEVTVDDGNTSYVGRAKYHRSFSGFLSCVSSARR